LTSQDFVVRCASLKTACGDQHVFFMIKNTKRVAPLTSFSFGCCRVHHLPRHTCILRDVPFLQCTYGMEAEGLLLKVRGRRRLPQKIKLVHLGPPTRVPDFWTSLPFARAYVFAVRQVPYEQLKSCVKERAKEVADEVAAVVDMLGEFVTNGGPTALCWENLTRQHWKKRHGEGGAAGRARAAR
jgi:hypothetical protein